MKYQMAQWRRMRFPVQDHRALLWEWQHERHNRRVASTNQPKSMDYALLHSQRSATSAALLSMLDTLVRPHVPSDDRSTP